MRKADYKNESIHLGFVVIDEKYRGQGLGKEMIGLAVTYAFEILKVKKVTLCVFDNNNSAHNCYKSAGFEDVRYIEDAFPYKDEKWGYYEMQIVKKGEE
jgi:RimJ/RimL family protein N-acetyltransferase